MALVRNLATTNRIFSKFSQNYKIHKKSIMTTINRSEKALEKLKSNEYFEKYADKIAKLQKTSPEEFLSRVEKVEKPKKGTKPLTDNQYSQLLHPKAAISAPNESPEPKLEEIMKIDLIKNKSTEEIKEIWKQYHVEKSFISAVIPTLEYNELKLNGSKFPTFLFPLPRSQGFEFIMCQFDRNSIHFTPLLYYQVHKENAPECLTIKHFVEFKENKGIVLMRGEFDHKIIDLKEAQCLANQLQLFYVRPNEEKLKILETFTKEPDKFKHMDLVKQIEMLSI